MDKDLFNTREAAAYLNLTEQQVKDLVTAGNLHAWSMPGRKGLTFRRDDLSALMLKAGE